MAKRKAASSNGAANKKKAVSNGNAEDLPEDESKHVEVSVLCLITSRDTESEIKKKTGVTSFLRQEEVRGAIERVASIKGSVRSVAEALVLEAKPNVRVLVHESLVLAAGLQEKCKEIAKSVGGVELSSSCLPFSNDRTIFIKNASENFQALVDVLRVLEEFKDTQPAFPHIPYTPRVLTGNYGRPDTFHRQALNQQLAGYNPYTNPEAMDSLMTPYVQQQQMPQSRPVQVANQSSAVTQLQNNPISIGNQGGVKEVSQLLSTVPANTNVQINITVPTECVGSIIGKGGSRISEIREQSHTAIKINEVPSSGERYERLGTIIGTSETIQTAVYLIHQRVQDERARSRR